MRFVTPIILGAALAVPFAAQAAPSNTLASAFSDGTPILDLRYRYEFVDQDNRLDNAHAQTLRTRVGFATAPLYGFSAIVEADNVTRLGAERYNDSRNGKSDYALVPDPDGTAINQALLRYQGEYANVTVGRQRFGLDNQRYIGGAAWRQNEQTFDAASLVLNPSDRLTLTYAYIDQVSTVFGPDGHNGHPNNAATIDSDSHLINLAYAFSAALKATLYYYHFDLQDLALSPTAPYQTQSTNNAGIRLTGTYHDLIYSLEYANQKDAAGNPWRLDSDYYLAELGYQHTTWMVKAGYEVLGGGNGPNGAFQTPLGTKHLYQGWADQFLVTPADGIKDAYLGGTLALLGGKLQGWYHDFRAEQGGDRYGREINLAYGHPIPGVKGLMATVKAARYREEGFSVDTDKAWVQLQYSY
ncbi:hypothetical protein CEK62_08375 [Alcanivorax sp. N3-2A]|nr:hypothetical protein CEK62_08375 [Alcanivorax sp. N3-2A]|tara:strand:- start:32165 stop:33403 length:1239 start_codon:yes stop_codon:yes gene_type:complete